MFQFWSGCFLKGFMNGVTCSNIVREKLCVSRSEEELHLDWKNNSDLASLGPLDAPLTSQHYLIQGFK